MPQVPSNQLTISFDHDELIFDSLLKGNFVIHIELQLPEEKIRWENAAALIKYVKQNQLKNTAFTIRRAPRTDLQELESLKHSTEAPFLLTLAGTRTPIQTIREEAATARSFGIRNFLAVTGNMDPLHQPQQDGSYQPLPNGYTDSLDILKALADPHKPQVLAATVNPFMYTPETQCLQYIKLIKKIKAGAQFLIAQSGWDMKKTQELQWFLQMREIILPVIARIRLDSPQTAAQLPTPEPGVVMPVPIAAKLQRLAEDPQNFYQFQTKLAALQAVGMEKMGYAGILLAGHITPQTLDQFLQTFKELDQSITSYDDWREQWAELIGDVSLAPPAGHENNPPHYLYKNLLQPEQPLYSKKICEFSDSAIAIPNPWTAFKVSMLAPQANGILAKAAKAIVKPKEKLKPCYGLDNASCPKRLIAGPCGNAQPDGFCEANHAPCFFNQIAQIAAQRNELELLENDFQ